MAHLSSTSTPSAPAQGDIPEALHLPRPKKYLTEDDICELLHCTKRAFRLRSDASKPPCIYLSKRRKLWDPDEVSTWLANLPRTRP